MTDGEFNSLRTQGSERPISVIQLMMDAKAEARRIDANQINAFIKPVKRGEINCFLRQPIYSWNQPLKGWPKPAISEFEHYQIFIGIIKKTEKLYSVPLCSNSLSNITVLGTQSFVI